MLGSRVLRTGDILTARQLEEMTFRPLQTREDRAAEVVYLPIYETRVEPAAEMCSISFSSRMRHRQAMPPAR